MRNDTSDCRAAGLVARAIPTGMLTRPKLMDPFQIVLMGPLPNCRGMQEVRRKRLDPCRRVLTLSSSGERTIVRLWRDAAFAGRTGAAYLVQAEPDRWHEVSWDEAARAVDELANGLLARGVRKGDTFGIVSRTRLEWTLFDFALALIGGITAPVYPNSSAREAAYVLQHAEVVGVLVEDEAQREKVEPLRLA